MIDQIVGFVLFTLGLKNPWISQGGQVRGVETQVATATISATPKLRPSESANLETLNRERTAALKAEILANRQKAISEYKTQRAAFKATLAGIKETRKKTLLSSIDASLESINTQKTTAMANHIATISDALTKASVKATEKGLATDDVTSAIAQADASIAAAKSAIALQAGKQYVISITSQTELRSSAQIALTQLKSDLEAIRLLMNQAREAVGNVIRLVYASTQMKAPSSTGIILPTLGTDPI